MRTFILSLATTLLLTGSGNLAQASGPKGGPKSGGPGQGASFSKGQPAGGPKTFQQGGKSFSGHSYSKHYHGWSSYCYFPGYGCYGYYSPEACSWYFYSPPEECY